MKKDFLTLKDYNGETITKIIKLAIKFKQNRPTFGNTVLKDKSVALIFEKSSTRTRVSLKLVYLRWVDIHFS